MENFKKLNLNTICVVCHEFDIQCVSEISKNFILNWHSVHTSNQNPNISATTHNIANFNTLFIQKIHHQNKPKKTKPHAVPKHTLYLHYTKLKFSNFILAHFGNE